MTRFRFSSMLACAAIACVAIASSAVGMTVRAVAATYAFAKDLVLGGFKLAAATTDVRDIPPIFLMQAKAFVLRLAKRERPEVSGNWRMCPST